MNPFKPGDRVKLSYLGKETFKSYETYFPQIITRVEKATCWIENYSSIGFSFLNFDFYSYSETKFENFYDEQV